MPAVKLIPNSRGFLIFESKIKGVSHNFMIDTGAEGTLLSPEFTNQCRKYRSGTIGGVNGITPAYSVSINFNLLGKNLREVGNVPSLFEDFYQDTGLTLSGLIGQDLLRQFSSYTIDNKNQKFIFEL